MSQDKQKNVKHPGIKLLVQFVEDHPDAAVKYLNVLIDYVERMSVEELVEWLKTWEQSLK